MAERRDPAKTASGLEGSSFDIPEKKKAKEKITPVGVYLDQDTRAEIERMVKDLGVKRHALLQFAIAYFLREYKKNPGIVEFEQKKTIKPI
jgi:hypothetical protein